MTGPIKRDIFADVELVQQQHNTVELSAKDQLASYFKRKSIADYAVTFRVKDGENELQVYRGNRFSIDLSYLGTALTGKVVECTIFFGSKTYRPRPIVIQGPAGAV